MIFQKEIFLTLEFKYRFYEWADFMNWPGPFVKRYFIKYLNGIEKKIQIFYSH